MRSIQSRIGIILAVLTIAPLAHAQLPFLGKPFGVSVTTDIDYGDGTIDSTTSPTTADLFLDLYEPTGAGVPALKPGLVLVHGGSWIVGSKDSSTFESSPGSGDFNTPMHEYAAEFAKRGYVCVSIDYRKILDDPDGTGLLSTGGADISTIVSLVQTLISGSVTVPDDQVRRSIEAGTADTVKAINWMIANAATYGIDPARIAVGGYSAGAFNSIWAAYVADAPVAAVFSNSGGIGSSNTSFISSPSDPPIIMFQGDSDNVVNVSNGQTVHAQLESIGVPHEYFEMVGENHYYLRTRPMAESPAKLAPGASLEENLAFFLLNNLNLLPLATAGVPATSNAGLYMLLVSIILVFLTMVLMQRIGFFAARPPRNNQE